MSDDAPPKKIVQSRPEGQPTRSTEVTMVGMPGGRALDR